jgi:hypothetical protein
MTNLVAKEHIQKLGDFNFLFLKYVTSKVKKHVFLGKKMVIVSKVAKIV